jgi:hypothetical protein
MARLGSKDEQYIEIIRACLTALHENYLYEKGLFRTNSSMTDVRLLRSQIQVDGFIPRSRIDPDPHVIVGVLHSSLKDLSYSFTKEIYDSMLNVDMKGGTQESTTQSIRSWLVKLPLMRFELVS